MRKSYFVLVDVRGSETGRRVILPVPFFVIDEALSGLADLASFVSWLFPWAMRRWTGKHDLNIAEMVNAAAAVVSEMRNHGVWTAVHVEAKGARVVIRFL